MCNGKVKAVNAQIYAETVNEAARLPSVLTCKHTHSSTEITHQVGRINCPRNSESTELLSEFSGNLIKPLHGLQELHKPH